MAENEKSVNGLLEKLALITDATQSLFNEGKSAVIFELNEKDYNYVRIQLNKFKGNENKFKIDISGVEIIFILKGSFEEVVETKSEEPIKKKNIIQRLRSYISGKPSV